MLRKSTEFQKTVRFGSERQRFGYRAQQALISCQSCRTIFQISQSETLRQISQFKPTPNGLIQIFLKTATRHTRPRCYSNLSKKGCNYENSVLKLFGGIEDFHRSLLLHDCFLFLANPAYLPLHPDAYRSLLWASMSMFPYHALSFAICSSSYFQMEWKLFQRDWASIPIVSHSFMDDSDLCTFG